MAGNESVTASLSLCADASVSSVPTPSDVMTVPTVMLCHMDRRVFSKCLSMLWWGGRWRHKLNAELPFFKEAKGKS